MNVYSIDIRVAATAYIRAKDADDALAKAQALTGLCLRAADHRESDVPISSLPYAHPDLPDVSLSPVMTIWEPSDRPEIAALNATRDGPVPQSYLDRFPPEHRDSADRAYQDGFQDGANSAD